mmetsp:Transcript_11900/g.28783  ORF Transcript_11900/g.28783 Transcript_11900/m.28783 type:complete len:467 (+) Transcript_11900:97-1497(+)
MAERSRPEVCKTASTVLREQGNEYYKRGGSQNDDVAIRKLALQHALRLYRQALDAGGGHGAKERSSNLKNIGMAHWRLSQCCFEENGASGIDCGHPFYHHATESMKGLDEALQAGAAAQGPGWAGRLREELSTVAANCVQVAMQVERKVGADMLTSLRNLVSRLSHCGPDVEVQLLWAAGELRFFQSVQLFDKGRLQPAIAEINHAIFAVRRARELASRLPAGAGDYAADLAELEASAVLQQSIYDGSAAIVRGDAALENALMGDEALDVGQVFDAVDHYKSAVLLTRGSYLLVEAHASSRIGYAFMEVMKLNDKARPYLKHAVELSVTLHPIDLTKSEWCVAAKAGLQKLRDLDSVRESAQHSARKDKHRSYLAPMEEEIREKAKAMSVPRFVEWLEATHPPRRKGALQAAGGSEEPKKLLQKALVRYHPDHNMLGGGDETEGERWFFLAEIITVVLNDLYANYK